MPLPNPQQQVISRSYEHTFASVSSSAIPQFPVALFTSSVTLSSSHEHSTRSIPNYLNVVRLLHLQYGYPNPLEDPLFKHQKTLLMRGIKRINGERVTQKLPITPDVLHKMQCHLHLDSSFDATFWAACLVAFFSFFRKSILLPPSTTEFETG